MPIKRIFKHLLFSDWQVRRAFKRDIRDSIEKSIHDSEELHGGEIRFVIEGGLDGIRLLKGQSSRARAIEVFSQLRVWDTEHNNGVLVYVLLADRAVEIVADRGIHVKVGDESWQSICQNMQQHFSKADFEAGALSGIRAIANVIGLHFSGSEKFKNELPDSPVMLN